MPLESPAPRTAPFLSKRAALAIGLLLVIVARVIYWAIQPVASEDAYITFRYALNLVHGHGLVYNLGERVMGYTSLPWTLWTALGMALHVAPEPWTRATSLACDLGTVFLVFEALGATSALCFAAFFSCLGLFSESAVSGLETSAFVLSAFAAGRYRNWWTLSLLALMRPEGLVGAILLSFKATLRNRLIALGVVAAVAIALTAYYGSPIPHSVVAKALVYHRSGPWVERRWWEWLSPSLLWGNPQSGEAGLMLAGAVAFSAAAACGLWTFRRAPVFLMALTGILCCLGYSLVGAQYFWWYMTLPVASFGLLAACGLPLIARGPWLYVAGALFLLGQWTCSPRLYFGRSSIEMREFMPTAWFIRGKAQPGDVVMAEPIGMIGYVTGLRMIDEIGLVSPEVTAARERGPGWYGDIVLNEKPTWLVTRKGNLEHQSSFAGGEAPFRDASQWEAVVSRYRKVGQSDSTGQMEVWRGSWDNR